ncbi:MAG: SRPBCC domain-containing protein [Thermoanaerobaculia bacterium]|nr:SRPBCC domain-containing protein [Thermoanaerobaculia bacterium]
MTLEVEKTIHLDASPERVWRAITEADELTAWFPESIEWEARQGGEGWLGWQSHGRFAARIEAFEPPRFLAWRWAREPDTSLDETDTTLVEWTLTPRDGGGTTLHLRESGFVAESYRDENDAGWDHELGELVEHLGEPEAAIA